MEEAVRAINYLLEQKIGVSQNSLRKQDWLRVIHDRMVLCGASNFGTYYDKIVSSPNEFQELVEAVVVPETWFFRDMESYSFLIEYIQKEWILNNKARPISILSMPCSSGEEPYSIAISLLESGLPPSDFQIAGVDISKKSLAKAMLGIYGQNSFRNKELDSKFKALYFDKGASGFDVRKIVRKSVFFQYGNAVDDNFLIARPVFDVIFCCNLFIYLNRKAQKKLIEVLNRLLANDGYLIVAPVEREMMRQAGFIFGKNHKKCACQKNTIRKDYKKDKSDDLLNALKMESDREKIKKSTALDALEEAGHLADSGDFDHATNLCLKCLKEYGMSAKAFFLLGLIKHAQGHEDAAEDFFQKTIYLEPFHHEALIYLKLLAEKRGDLKQAELFARRAHRLESSDF